MDFFLHACLKHGGVGRKDPKGKKGILLRQIPDTIKKKNVYYKWVKTA